MFVCFLTAFCFACILTTFTRICRLNLKLQYFRFFGPEKGYLGSASESECEWYEGNATKKFRLRLAPSDIISHHSQLFLHLMRNEVWRGQTEPKILHHHLTPSCAGFVWVLLLGWVSILGPGQTKNRAQRVNTGPVTDTVDVRSDDGEGTGHPKWH